MSRNYETRSGFTLTEVLMAMFVMAIGMISLLALFPVAFQNAKWALDSEQVARSAANARSMTEMAHVSVDALGMVSTKAQSMRSDDLYSPDSSGAWGAAAGSPPAVSLVNAAIGRNFFLRTDTGAWTFMTDINAPKPTTTARVKLPPVFVDPYIACNASFINAVTGLPFHVGINSKEDPTGIRAPFASPFNYTLGVYIYPNVFANSNPALRPNGSIGIPRLALSHYGRDQASGANWLYRMQMENSMGDEIDFANNGQPNGTIFSAQRRFTWAYMCQWYDYNTPEVCDITTVVFNSRPNNGGLATFPPGEETFHGYPETSNAAGLEAPGPASNFGRCFVKGLSQACVKLESPQPMNVKTGDWILDSKLILPELDKNTATGAWETAPFLDEYSIDTTIYVYPQGAGAPHRLRPGLVGGNFYKILDISAVQRDTVSGLYYQTITLNRPAKSDGFSLTTFAGIADVITKGVGRMPQH